MQPAMLQAGRPYVSFERRGIEKRRPQGHPEEGMLYVDEVDFVKVTPQGSKDIFEKAAVDWFDQLRMKVNMGMEPMENLLHYERLFEAYKKGQDLPLDGTPIKGWPLATMAEQQRCIGINLLTVENLANCNQEALNRLGMGAQALRNRAVEWLQAKTDTGPLVMRMDAMQATLDRLAKRNEELEAENRVLRQMKGPEVAPQPVGGSAVVHVNVDQPEMSDPNLVDDTVDLELRSV